MQFTYALCDVVSQRAYVLEADATGMNTVKNQEFFFFFLNLEKQQRAQNTIKKLIVDDRKNADQTFILECIREFFETLFKKREQKTATEIKSFLSHINIQ